MNKLLLILSKRAALLLMFMSIHVLLIGADFQSVKARIFQMDLKGAEKEINAALILNPNSSDFWNLKFQKYFIEIMLLENDEVRDEWYEDFNTAVKKIEKDQTGRTDKNYLLSDIYLRDCIIRMLDGKELASIGSFKKSHSYYKDFAKSNPDNPLVKKLDGLYSLIAGTVPERFDWVKNLIGLDGNADQGIEKFTDFLKITDSSGEFDETVLYYSLFSSFVQGKSESAFNYLYNLKESVLKRPMVLLACSVIAESEGKTEIALDLFNDYRSGIEFDLPLLDLQQGRFMLFGLKQGADIYFIKYIQSCSDGMFADNAYQYLYWYYLIFNNKNLSSKYYEFMKQRYNNGDINSNSAVAEYIKTGEKEFLPLLRVEMLYNGGYYKRALDELDNSTASVLMSSSKKHKIEYFYRKARILQKLDENAEAINYYKRTLRYCAGEDWYFDVISAINIAEIHEEAGNISEAESYFKKALEINHGVYKDSFERQAKDGLQRLKQ